MPERGRPASLYATPACAPISSNFPSAAVGVQKVLHGIVGNEEIHAAVVVDVGCNHSPRLAEMTADS